MTRFDLVQVHNLLSWQEHLPTLFAMKGAGQIRYVGITTSEGRRHRDIEQIMRSRPIDFVQVTYNPADREVEERILPLARDRGIAVIVIGHSAKARWSVHSRNGRCPRGPPTSTARAGLSWC